MARAAALAGGHFSDLRIYKEGVRLILPTSQGKGNGQGEEPVCFFLWLKLNPLLKSKVRKNTSHFPLR